MTRANAGGSSSEIVGLIAAGQARSRTDIARLTGLARSTVSHRVGALISDGLLIEEQSGPSSGGRPPIGLRLNPRAGLILAADIGATHLRVALADLAGTEIAEHSADLHVDAGPGVVMPVVIGVMRDLLEAAGRKPRDVRGIGIGVPGPVQFRTGTVIRPPIMPGWDGVRIPTYFETIFTAPVLVDNDVNVMALGEYGARGSAAEQLLFIRVGSGIGCGIVDDGRIHRGPTGRPGTSATSSFPTPATPCAGAATPGASRPWPRARRWPGS